MTKSLLAVALGAILLCTSALDYCQAPLPKYSAPSSGLKLRQVAVFSRHGDRSPLHVLPKEHSESGVEWKCDQHIFYGTNVSADGDVALSYSSYMSLNNIWSSRVKAWRGNCFPGQLTKEGAAMTYELGKALREIYVNQFKLLPETLDPSTVYFRATGVPRAQQSLFSILQGLYPASTRRNGAAVPFHVMADDYDTMVPNSAACPRITSLLSKAKEQSGYVKELKKASSFVEKAISITGATGTLNNVKAVTAWMDILYSRICHNFPLPCKDSKCVTKNDAAVIGEVGTYIINHEYDVNASGSGYEPARLTAGPLLNELLEFQEKMVNGDASAPRYLHFSGHDTTLVPIMAALQSHFPSYAPYASHIIFELYESESNSGNFYIRALYNNKALVIPECWNTLCPFKTYKNLINSHLTIKDVSKECTAK